jgi:hypothetical protein
MTRWGLEHRNSGIIEKAQNAVYSKYYSERDKCFSFILTHADNTNTLYKIIPSKLYVNIPHIGCEKWFEFNLKQMKIIDSFSNDQKEIESFFKRLVFVSNKQDKIILDTEKLENITPMLFKCMQMYGQNSDNKTNWVVNYM